MGFFFKVFNTFFFFYIIIYFYIITFLLLCFTCTSAFEQGHLEPWRYYNALLLLLLLLFTQPSKSLLAMDSGGNT